MKADSEQPVPSPSGTTAELDALVPVAYEHLRAIAHRQLQHSGGSQTLSTTALVHEAYLKLNEHGPWRDRTHFLAVASIAMRQILIDFVRRRRAQKRGSGVMPVELTEWCSTSAPADAQADMLIALDEALTRLASVDRRLARVVELRFFGGMSVDEAAAALAVSGATVRRDTRVARAFLARELQR